VGDTIRDSFIPRLKSIHFILVLLFLLTGACNTAEKKSQESDLNNSIEGIISGGNGMVLVLEKRHTAVESFPIDSFKIGSDGKFEFHFNVPSIGFYRVFLSNRNGVNLILKPGEKIKFNTKAEDLLASLELEGSEGSSLIKDLTQYMQKIYRQTDSLGNEMRQHQTIGDYSGYTAAATKYSILQSQLAKYIMDFIEENPKSLATLVAVGALDPETHFEYFKKVVDSLAPIVPNEPFYTVLKDKVNEWSILAPGAPAPEITLNDIHGKPLSLSSLKGDVVLLDFWASWCRPCRMQNPHVVELYNKFKDKGFTVFSVSLDGLPQQQDPKSDWIKAIEHDGLTWENHVSELRGWNSSVVPEYRIKSIPMTVLIDREGIIAAKNLQGEPLKDKIMMLLNNTMQ